MAGEGSDRSGGPVPTTAHRTGRTPGRGGGARWGTAGWGVIDQALSSITNFGVGLAAARATGPASFGAFSVAFATYLLGVGATRALVSEVYAVRHATAVLPSDDAASRYPEAGEAWGATALLGLLAAVACLAAAAGAAGDLRIALGLVAVAFPVLVLHDVARYILITRRDAFGAMLLDLAWVVGFGGGLGVTAGLGRFPGAMATLALWIGGAACGVLVAAWRLRTLPDVRRGPAFLQRVRRSSLRYLGDWLALGATVHVAYYLLGATAGLAVVGELRAALLLVGPLNIVVTGAATVAVPELRRHYAERGTGVRPAVLLSAGLVGMAVVWLGFVAALPQRLVLTLLGGTAAGATTLISVLLAYTAANMGAQGPLIALRATGDVRRGTRATLPVAPFVLLGPAIGASSPTVPAVRWWRGRCPGRSASRWRPANCGLRSPPARSPTTRRRRAVGVARPYWCGGIQSAPRATPTADGLPLRGGGGGGRRGPDPVGTGRMSGATNWLDDVEVRVLQPYQATKAYRCPGCHRDIPSGTGHVVVLPREAPDLRRHWHKGCWALEDRRRLGRLGAGDAGRRP